VTGERAIGELMTLAIDFAELASELHRARLQTDLLVDTKSSDSDLVSDVDRDAQAMIIERLLAQRPQDDVLAEEGAYGEGTSGVGQIADIRRSGSAALDLCRLAAGSVDAFFELDLAPWDYAAGSIIAMAAGARVLHTRGTHGQGPAVVAAHPSLLAPLTELLCAAGALTEDCK
jgi:fructose-1,6-bisphosphatase/inositol monophosphatase family enzyme